MVTAVSLVFDLCWSMIARVEALWSSVKVVCMKGKASKVDCGQQQAMELSVYAAFAYEFNAQVT